jgi:hypothetical protein
MTFLGGRLRVEALVVRATTVATDWTGVVVRKPVYCAEKAAGRRGDAWPARFVVELQVFPLAPR